MAKSRLFGSIDEFRRAARDANAPIDQARVRAAFDTAVKVGEGDSRAISFTISTASVDRMGDTIAVDGWQLGAYRKNPVVLWAHDSSMLPVGKAPKVWMEGEKLRADAEFTPKGMARFNDTIFEMYKGGFLNATSVGFLPVKYAFAEDADRRFGIDFLEQELLEFSCVPVPANPEALIEGRSAGIDLAPMLGWAERIITASRVAEARADAQWECEAAEDLPIDDGETWDGAAATKRMLDAAGFDGDSPDVEMARRGFLASDAGNATLRGSYKLPFADIINDKLTAVAGGLKAAAARLSSTDIPDGVKAEAQDVLDEYASRSGKALLDWAESRLRLSADSGRIIRLAESVLGTAGDGALLAWAERIIGASGNAIMPRERIERIERAAKQKRLAEKRERDLELIRARAG